MFHSNVTPDTIITSLHPPVAPSQILSHLHHVLTNVTTYSSHLCNSEDNFYVSDTPPPSLSLSKI